VNVNVTVNDVIQTRRRTDAIPVIQTMVDVVGVVVAPSMMVPLRNSRRDTWFGHSRRQTTTTRVRVLTNSVDATVRTWPVNWEHCYWHSSEKYYYSNEWTTHSRDQLFLFLLVSLHSGRQFQ